MNNFKWNNKTTTKYPKQGSLIEFYNFNDCIKYTGFVTDEGKFWVENKTGILGDENTIKKWRHAKIIANLSK